MFSTWESQDWDLNVFFPDSNGLVEAIAIVNISVFYVYWNKLIFLKMHEKSMSCKNIIFVVRSGPETYNIILNTVPDAGSSP